jgi:hypothetical protein
LKLAFPRPGEVIRYSYLWHSEAERGREEGSKDRPCVVMVANVQTRRVWVLPVTHAWPGPGDSGVELPADSKRRLGLDDEASWIAATELNEFAWPGPDLRQVPNKLPKTCSYGLLPGALYEKLRGLLVHQINAELLRTVSRTQ